MMHSDSSPTSPCTLAAADETIRGSGTKSQTNNSLQLKSHNDGNQHFHSDPDIPSALSRQSNKKRKFEGEECSLMEMFEETFASFAAKLEVKIEGLQATISTIKHQNIELTKGVDLMSAKHDEIMSRLTVLEREQKEDKKLIRTLEDKIENLEKKNRATGIEIHNIQKNTGESKEDLCKVVNELGKTIKVDISNSLIKDIYRINKKENSHPSVIVEFTNVMVKENVLRETRAFNKNKEKGNKLNSTHLKLKQQNKPVFVTETLTPKNQRLFYLARTFQKEYKYAFCWTSHGTVYLRQNVNVAQIRITTEDDIETLRKKT